MLVLLSTVALVHALPAYLPSSELPWLANIVRFYEESLDAHRKKVLRRKPEQGEESLFVPPKMVISLAGEPTYAWSLDEPEWKEWSLDEPEREGADEGANDRRDIEAPIESDVLTRVLATLQLAGDSVSYDDFEEPALKAAYRAVEDVVIDAVYAGTEKKLQVWDLGCGDGAPYRHSESGNLVFDYKPTFGAFGDRNDKIDRILATEKYPVNIPPPTRPAGGCGCGCGAFLAPITAPGPPILGMQVHPEFVLKPDGPKEFVGTHFDLITNANGHCSCHGDFCLFGSASFACLSEDWKEETDKRPDPWDVFKHLMRPDPESDFNFARFSDILAKLTPGGVLVLRHDVKSWRSGTERSDCLAEDDEVLPLSSVVEGYSGLVGIFQKLKDLGIVSEFIHVPEMVSGPPFDEDYSGMSLFVVRKA